MSTAVTATLAVCVVQRREVAQDIVCLELADPQGRSLPPFSAGSHIDLHLGASGAELVRPYSLCNDPEESHRYVICVLRDPASRGGSEAVHAQLQVGTRLHVSTPRNHFALVPSTHTVLFAGGIGITPILCMAERLQRTGAAFELHYAARTPQRMAFREEILAAPYARNASLYFSQDPVPSLIDAAAVLARCAPDTHVYVCGPLGFIETVVAAARRLGWPEAQIHREHFGAPPVDSGADTAFEVQVASSGAVHVVPPGRSIVAVLAEHGVEVPVSCEQGVCGTCLLRVLSGTPEHRDLYLTDSERAANDQILPCCSRASTPRLVLDL